MYVIGILEREKTEGYQKNYWHNNGQKLSKCDRIFKYTETKAQ